MDKLNVSERLKKGPLALGMDLGFGRSKITLGNTGGSIDYLSVVQHTDSSKVDKAETHFSYRDDTGRYLVGEDALLYGKPETRSVDSSFFESPELRVLGLYGAEQFIDPERIGKGHLDAHVVTGLPVEFFKSHARELEKYIKGWNNRLVRVTGANVVMQPVGAMMDVGYDWDGKVIENFQNRRVAILDIGRGSIDGVEVIKNRVHPNNIGGASTGISRLHDDLYAEITRKWSDIDLHRWQMDQVCREGYVIYNGEEKSIEAMYKKERREMVKRVVATMKDIWPKTTGLYKIIVVGGGADMLREELEQVIPEGQLVIPENPSLANANGFAKLARSRIA